PSFYCYCGHPAPPSFPTRRSSDLTLLRRDDDRARELREELAPLRVGRALLVLDRGPLAMPGHSSPPVPGRERARAPACRRSAPRSEEHTSELQSRFDLVCRLLLEK